MVHFRRHSQLSQLPRSSHVLSPPTLSRIRHSRKSYKRRGSLTRSGAGNASSPPGGVLPESIINFSPALSPKSFGLNDIPFIDTSSAVVVETAADVSGTVDKVSNSYAGALKTAFYFVLVLFCFAIPFRQMSHRLDFFV